MLGATGMSGTSGTSVSTKTYTAGISGSSGITGSASPSGTSGYTVSMISTTLKIPAEDNSDLEEKKILTFSFPNWEKIKSKLGF